MEINFLYSLDLIGTAVFAVTGALAAGLKRMDIFGVIVLACVTALGGGTIRDTLLGIYPIFWISNILYLAVAVTAGITTFCISRFITIPYKGLVYADALGLAVFTVVGAKTALFHGHSAFIAVIMGVITAVVGGIVRDVLSGKIPMILRQEIYATASICGAFVFITLLSISDITFAALISIMVTLIIRLSAVRWNISLPIFISTAKKSENN